MGGSSQDRTRGLKWWVVRVVSGGEVDGLEDFLRGKSLGKVLKCGPRIIRIRLVNYH